MAKPLTAEQAHWVPLSMADGHEFEIAGARGCLERINLPNGLTLYRCELNVYEDCILSFETSTETPWLGTSIHLVGESLLQTPDNRQFTLNASNSLLLRVDPFGSQFHLKAGQIIRHLGVSCAFKNLPAFFPNSVPDALKSFAVDENDYVHVENIPANHKLRSLASHAFSSQIEGEQKLLKLQGVASLFFAEMLDIYSGQQDQSSDFADWEHLLIADVVKKIKLNLQMHLTAPTLAAEVGLTPGRLDTLFKAQLQKSCAEFIRSERLVKAKHLLHQGDLQVKAVALAVGYKHMGNFSRAYQKYFGETPARTLRRD